MSITRFDPLRDFVSLREVMDRLVEDSVIRPSALLVEGHAATFPVDLSETAAAFVLKATLPGVRPEDVDVNATSEGVSIKAEVKADERARTRAGSSASAGPVSSREASRSRRRSTRTGSRRA